jgi:hypothetical protein
MSTKKTPFVDISDAMVRIILMFIMILIGIVCSLATANAAVKKERNPFTHTIKKNSDYSCKELSKKHKKSSNIVVKSNARKPKWR